MSNKLVLTDNVENLLDNKGNFDDIRISFDVIPGIYVYIDSNIKLEKELGRISKNKLHNKLNEIDTNSNRYFKNQIIQSFKKISFDSVKDIIDTIDFIELDFNKTNLIEYIKNNKILSNKKIIINEHINIDDFNKINNLLEQYKDIKDNIYVDLQYDNYKCINLISCLNIMNEVKNITTRIKNYNLSPIENIMYVYDLVRKNETKSKKINDEFESLLKQLGINVNSDILYNNYKASHKRIIINVLDEKYGIDGLYYFDPERDSLIYDFVKLYNYNSFAKTLKEINLNNKMYDYKKLPTTKEEFLKIIRNNKGKNIFLNIDYINWIYRLCTLTDTEKIDINVIDKDTDEKLDLLFSKINKPLDSFVLVKILHNVRKIEYLEDDKTPFSLADYHYTSEISNWSFIDKNDNLFNFNGKKYVEIEAEKFYNFIKSTNIEEEIKGLKNEKVLKLNNQML